MEKVTGIHKAIKAAGSQKALAEKLTQRGRPITQQGVGYWAKTGRVHADWIVDVESVTGVSRFELRPDLYAISA